jgi:hypothetical protein
LLQKTSGAIGRFEEHGMDLSPGYVIPNSHGGIEEDTGLFCQPGIILQLGT